MPQSRSGRAPVARRATPEAEAGRTGPLERLLVRSGTGDTKAFDALYDQLAPRVFGTVSCLIRDEDASESVTREAFVEAWVDTWHSVLE